MRSGKLAGRRRGMYLVNPQDKVPSPFFRVGEQVRESGVYRVFHSGHRLSHEVTLIAAQDFPRCSQCGHDVHFELLQAAPDIEKDANFRSRRLYEIPHPDDQDQQDLKTA